MVVVILLCPNAFEMAAKGTSFALRRFVANDLLAVCVETKLYFSVHRSCIVPPLCSRIATFSSILAIFAKTLM